MASHFPFIIGVWRWGKGNSTSASISADLQQTQGENRSLMSIQMQTPHIFEPNEYWWQLLLKIKSSLKIQYIIIIIIIIK